MTRVTWTGNGYIDSHDVVQNLDMLGSSIGMTYECSVGLSMGVTGGVGSLRGSKFESLSVQCAIVSLTHGYRS